MAKRTQATMPIGSVTGAPWHGLFCEAGAALRRLAGRCYRGTVPAAVAAVVMVGLSSAPGSAMGTAEDRAACIPDAFRLCSAAIPDADRVIACLKTERVKLSTACRVAMRRNGAI